MNSASAPVQAKQRLSGGETVELRVRLEPAVDPDQAQAVPFEVVHEDSQILVVNKPAGLVMHPAAGNPDGTLLNGLLHLDPDLARLPRAGIVHRLDKDTSGLLVVARTLPAHQALVAALAERRVHREYLALVRGDLIAGGTVAAPVGRHPVDRKRMAVVRSGRSASTHYRIAERLSGFTLLRCILETGRTHQIRVHMAHLGHPLLGDPVYGGRLQLPQRCPEGLAEVLRGFRRQALHAARLEFQHPASGRLLHWQAEPPADFQGLLAALREHAG